MISGRIRSVVPGLGVWAGRSFLVCGWGRRRGLSVFPGTGAGLVSVSLVWGGGGCRVEIVGWFASNLDKLVVLTYVFRFWHLLGALGRGADPGALVSGFGGSGSCPRFLAVDRGRVGFRRGDLRACFGFTLPICFVQSCHLFVCFVLSAPLSYYHIIDLL